MRPIWLLGPYAVLALAFMSGQAQVMERDLPTESLADLVDLEDLPSGEELPYPDSVASGMLVGPVGGRLQVIFPYGGSRAAKAGIRPGDVITAIRGVEYCTGSDRPEVCAAQINSIPVGAEFTLVLERAGERREVTLVREETTAPETLYPAETADGDWGYITADGLMFLPPVYDAAGEFCDGMAQVQFGPSCEGYINMLGQSFAADYFIQLPFSEGRAQVAERYRWGYINRAGELVVPLRYSRTGRFSERRAAVMNEAGFYGYIDRRGAEVIIPALYTRAGEFHEGRAAVRFGSGDSGRYGYIYPWGNLRIDPVYIDARDFSEGRAAVRDAGSRRWGYVDTAGGEVIPAAYSVARDFSGGLAAVSRDRMRFGYIDREGRKVIEERYDSAAQFSEARAAVHAAGSTRWGYIDTAGNEVIPAAYVAAGDFSGGLAAISTDGREYGYIDHEGRTVIPERYRRALPFRGALARVWLGERSAYIDKTGRTIWPPD